MSLTKLNIVKLQYLAMVISYKLRFKTLFLLSPRPRPTSTPTESNILVFSVIELLICDTKVVTIFGMHGSADSFHKCAKPKMPLIVEEDDTDESF